MFDTLYRSEQARCRHRSGPLAAERERYLQHCANAGGSLGTQLVRSRALLWVAQRMSPSDFGGIDLPRLKQIVHETVSPPPARYTAQALINFSRPWLIFLGWWQEPRGHVPFADHLHRFVAWMRDERGLSSSTVAQWGSGITAFLRWLGQTGRDLSTLRSEDIDQYFVTYGAQRWCRVSAGHAATMLRVFLRHGASIGACDRRLAQAINGPRVYKQESLPYALDWNDVRRVLAGAESDSPRDVRDRAILMLLSIYGLRRGEVAALQLCHIDWEGKRLLVPRLKRRQPQVFPLLPSVSEALARYIDCVRPQVPNPQVFIRLHAPHRPITAGCLYSTVSRRLRALNIKAAHVGPHALRHACAVRLLAEGFNLKEIGDHLGHRSTSATSIYAKVDLAALRDMGDFDIGELQ